MSFAAFYGATSEQKAHQTLATALDLEVDFLDTANIYGMGLSAVSYTHLTLPTTAIV